MVDDNYLIEDTEYTNGKNDEEEPILIAQRYLNIFHQIHIFNAAKKEEFDKSLLEMPEKVKELMVTLPGGRILLEHLHDVEEKLGRNSSDTERLIAQDIPEGEKQQLITSKAQGGVIAASEISLGADFADNLANSLAFAFKNNHLLQNNKMEEISQLLCKSFNAYASNMQHLTENLVHSTQQISARQLTQTATVQPVATPNAPQQSTPAMPQVNTQTNNANNTTINNHISMDSSIFNSLNQTLLQNDEKRHADFLQIVDALNKNSASLSQLSQINAATISQLQTMPVHTGGETPTVIRQVVPESMEVPALAITNSVTEALKVNNAQQLEAIKAFGEILVEALLQSQQELAQTIVQSAPRHTVRVVVSQDVEVENQTSDTSAATNKTPTFTSPAKKENKKDSEKKEKNNFMKSFSEKISETTNKFAQNMAEKQQKKPEAESLLSKINKGLDKLNDFKKADKNKDNNQSKPAERQQKPDNKQEQGNKNQNKPLNNEKKPAATASFKETSSFPSKEEKKNTPPQPVLKEEPKPTADIDDILAALPDEEPLLSPLQNTPTEPLSDIKTSPVSKTEFPQPLPETANKAPLSEPLKAEQSARQETPAPVTVASVQPAPAPKTENNPRVQNISAKPSISAPATPPAPKKDSVASSAYADALNKIKNALNEDTQVLLADIDVKPVSLNEDEQPELSPIDETQIQDIADDEISLDDDDVFNSVFSKNTKQNDNDGEWEYVDENGNPVSDSQDDGEWEYVDENGNPVSDSQDDGEWEYVDENGNPVSASQDDGEWEYVDENGNPVSDSQDDGEWEYVDENGNPVSDSQDDGEWEYVDEDGNPVSGDYHPEKKE